MSRIEESTVVDVPVHVAYDQWTQFETFPQFMEGVRLVTQKDDKHLEWTAEVGGHEKTWTAEIVDQTPGVRIAWKSIDGAENAGAVRFQGLAADRTRIDLTIDAEPRRPVEKAGDALGFLQRQVKGDLERFKEFIEDRGAPTGAWRGEIHGDEVRPDGPDLGRAVERAQTPLTRPR
jgi:uncharacterized membrane protein